MTGSASAPAEASEPAPATIGSAPPSDGRAHFVRRVVEAFEAAEVEYVLLHAYGSERAADSDLDVAVTRESLATVDQLVRSGTLGRLVQCIHYDIPWCRWYVVETDDPGRRYRELDVACDPWGIGRYGPAVPLALSHRDVRSGTSVPQPAAEVAYLAVKRACKGLRRHGDHGQLLAVFARDPAGAAELLERHFGEAGAALAAALEQRDREPTRELQSLRRVIGRGRRRPALVGCRALFSALRLLRRITRPTGLVVWIVGPDGVGKSTQAETLERAAAGAFRSVARLHVRPGLLPEPARLLGRRPSDGSEPHGRAPSSIAGSLARLSYLWVDGAAGWLPKIALPRVRSSLVIVERGWLDLSVDPLRYRLSLPGAVLRAFTRLLPGPDLVLLLDAPPHAIHRRKQELSVAEIQRQLHVWRRLAAKDPSRFSLVDASGRPESVLGRIVSRIDDRLASRQTELSSCGVALRALGAPSRNGRKYVVIARRGRPRWLLPAGPRGPGPSRAGLYRASRSKDSVGALALEFLLRTGARRFAPSLTLDPGEGLGPTIAARLGVPRVELATAAARDDHRGDRALVSVLIGERPVAFAKVAREEAARLAHERDVLETLAGRPLHRFAVPDVLDFFTWKGCAVLLLRPIPTPGHADRATSRSELDALAELAELAEPLAPLLGRRAGHIPVHGDFAPWNSGPLETGALALWDWESARLGLPLEDLFYWRVQRLLLFGVGDAPTLVAGALEPDCEVLWLCGACGARPELAPVALRACLERSLAVWAGSDIEAGDVRRVALGRLEEALG